MRASKRWIWVSLLTTACTASAPPAEEGTKSASSGGANPPPPTSGSVQAPASARPVGAWSSPSCGDRKYTRELSFADDGTFSARDLVSPCPPGAACVWSGIVDRAGRWKQQGAHVTLTVERGADATAGAAFVTELELEADALVEALSGQRCAYVRR